jgi:hypothetical protein
VLSGELLASVFPFSRERKVFGSNKQDLHVNGRHASFDLRSIAIVDVVTLKARHVMSDAKWRHFRQASETQQPSISDVIAQRLRSRRKI